MSSLTLFSDILSLSYCNYHNKGTGRGGSPIPHPVFSNRELWFQTWTCSLLQLSTELKTKLVSAEVLSLYILSKTERGETGRNTWCYSGDCGYFTVMDL